MIIARYPLQRDLRVLCRNSIDEAAPLSRSPDPSCIPVRDEIGGDKLHQRTALDIQWRGTAPKLAISGSVHYPLAPN